MKQVGFMAFIRVSESGYEINRTAFRWHFLESGIVSIGLSGRSPGRLLRQQHPTAGKRRHGRQKLGESWCDLRNVVEDWVRQAKADFTVALSCPNSSMAPVLAVAGMVADHHRFDGDLTPLESFINLSQPGRA